MSNEGTEQAIGHDGLVYKRITVIDHAATGELMRSLRKDAGLSLRKVAGMIEVSAPYLSDLELGRRNWTRDRVREIREAFRKTKEHSSGRPYRDTT